MAAPLGNQNAVKGKRWAKAIERAMDAWPERPVSLEINKGIDSAAFEFVAKLMQEKDLGFFKELGDRFDGKAHQAIVGDDDLPPIKHEATVRYVKPDA